MQVRSTLGRFCMYGWVLRLDVFCADVDADDGGGGGEAPENHIKHFKTQLLVT